jgi:hypothetical protein
MSRIFLTVAAVAATLAFAPRAAEAAMPVSGALQSGVGSDIVLAQAPPAAAPAATTETPAAPAAKKKSKKQTRQQEADQSVQSGTVPKRYMGSVPKEYHHLIPFSK